MAVDLNQPQVAAAIFGGGVAAVVSLIVAFVNQLFLRAMHKQRLGIDRELAERKITADMALAERKLEFDKALSKYKVDLDAALAERKLALDQELVAWRRRYDIAEQILTSAYQARDALKWARARVILGGEGETRKSTESESDKLRAQRNSLFVPIERLSNNSKPFATLQTLQDSVAAHLGTESIKPISQLLDEHRKITDAASHLVRLADGYDRSGGDPLRSFYEELWGPGADTAFQRIDAAIEQLEAVCKPILLVKAPG